jgi:predicted RecA/RadA family phage recombinase
MKKKLLCVLAAVMMCGSVVITTSCETLLKGTLDVIESAKFFGVWEVAKYSSNGGSTYAVGSQWTFDSQDLAYNVDGETGKWIAKEGVLYLTPKGKSEEIAFGTITSSSKKEIVIDVNGYNNHNGTVTIKKIKDLETKK